MRTTVCILCLLISLVWGQTCDEPSINSADGVTLSCPGVLSWTAPSGGLNITSCVLDGREFALAATPDLSLVNTAMTFFRSSVLTHTATANGLFTMEQSAVNFLGQLDFTAESFSFIRAQIQGSGPWTVDSLGGDIVGSGLLDITNTGGNLLRSTTNILLEDVNFAQDMTVDAAEAVELGAMNGQSGFLSVTAGHHVEATSLATGEAISVQAGTGITVNGEINSLYREIFLITSAGPVDVDSVSTDYQSVSMEGDSVTIRRTARTGNLNITAHAGAVTMSNLMWTASLTANAATNITVTDMGGAGSVAFTAGDSVYLRGTLVAGSVNVHALTGDIQTPPSIGALTLRAEQGTIDAYGGSPVDLRGHKVILRGEEIDADIYIESGSSVEILGSVSSQTQIYAVGNITVSGFLYGFPILHIYTESGDISVGDMSSSNYNVSGHNLLLGNLEGQDIQLSSTGATVTGYIESQSWLLIDSLSNVTVNGTMVAREYAQITAVGDIWLQDEVRPSGNISLYSTFGDITTVKSFSFDLFQAQAPQGRIHMTGRVASNSQVELNGLQVNVDSLFASSVVVTSQSTINVTDLNAGTAQIFAPGDIDFSSISGNVHIRSENGYVRIADRAYGGNMQIEGRAVIISSYPGGSITIRSDTIIRIEDGLRPEAATLIAPDGVFLGGRTVITPGSFALETNGPFEAVDFYVYQHLHLRASYIRINGTLTTDSTAILESAGDLELQDLEGQSLSTLLVNGTIRVDTIDSNGALQAVAQGNVEFNSSARATAFDIQGQEITTQLLNATSGSVTVLSNTTMDLQMVSSAANAILRAPDGIQTGALTAVGAVEITSSSGDILARMVQTDGPVELNATNVVVDQLIQGDTVDIYANTVSVRDILSVSRTNILAGSDITVNGAVNCSAGDITITSTGGEVDVDSVSTPAHSVSMEGDSITIRTGAEYQVMNVTSHVGAVVMSNLVGRTSLTMNANTNINVTNLFGPSCTLTAGDNVYLEGSLTAQLDVRALRGDIETSMHTASVILLAEEGTIDTYGGQSVTDIRGNKVILRGTEIILITDLHIDSRTSVDIFPPAIGSTTARVTAVDKITLNGSLTTTDALEIHSESGDVIGMGSLGGLTLVNITGSDLLLRQIGGGNVHLSSTGDMETASITPSGWVRMDSLSDISVNGSITATGAYAELTAVGDISVEEALITNTSATLFSATGHVTLANVGTALFQVHAPQGRIRTQGPVQVSGSIDLHGQQVDGNLLSGSLINITSQSTVTLGTTNAAASVTIKASDDIQTSSLTGGNVHILSEMGDVNVTGGMLGNDVQIEGHAVTLSGSSATNLIVRSDTYIRVRGNLLTSENLTLIAPDGVFVEGLVQPTGTLDLQTGGPFEARGFTVTQSVNLQAASFLINGIATTAGALLESEGDLEIQGWSNPGTSPTTLLAQGTIRLGYGNSNGAFKAVSQGHVQINSTLRAASVEIQGQEVITAGFATTSGNVSIVSDTIMNIQGTNSAADLHLEAPDGIQTETLTASSGVASLVSEGPISCDTVIAGGLRLRGSQITTGMMIISGDSDIQASGDFHSQMIQNIGAFKLNTTNAIIDGLLIGDTIDVYADTVKTTGIQSTTRINIQAPVLFLGSFLSGSEVHVSGNVTTDANGTSISIFGYSVNIEGMIDMKNNSLTLYSLNDTLQWRSEPFPIAHQGVLLAALNGIILENVHIPQNLDILTAFGSPALHITNTTIQGSFSGYFGSEGPSVIGLMGEVSKLSISNLPDNPLSVIFPHDIHLLQNSTVTANATSNAIVFQGVLRIGDQLVLSGFDGSNTTAQFLDRIYGLDGLRINGSMEWFLTLTDSLYKVFLPTHLVIDMYLDVGVIDPTFYGFYFPFSADHFENVRFFHRNGSRLVEGMTVMSADERPYVVTFLQQDPELASLSRAPIVSLGLRQLNRLTARTASCTLNCGESDCSCCVPASEFYDSENPSATITLNRESSPTVSAFTVTVSATEVCASTATIPTARLSDSVQLSVEDEYGTQAGADAVFQFEVAPDPSVSPSPSASSSQSETPSRSHSSSSTRSPTRTPSQTASSSPSSSHSLSASPTRSRGSSPSPSPDPVSSSPSGAPSKMPLPSPSASAALSVPPAPVPVPIPAPAPFPLPSRAVPPPPAVDSSDLSSQTNSRGDTTDLFEPTLSDENDADSTYYYRIDDSDLSVSAKFALPLLLSFVCLFLVL